MVVSGQSDATWTLQPGVYRLPTTTEEDQLKLERHLTQDFRVMSAGLRGGQETDAELYFLQQHYRMPTRLLDWSSVALAGLFFAVKTDDKSDKANGRLFVMDAYQLALCQKAEAGDFLGIATSTNPTFVRALEIIAHWRTKDFPKFIMPVRPDFFDRRMSFQRSGFTFHVPYRPVLTEQANSTLRSFLIPSSQKAAIRQQLSLLGITPFTIYGDLDRFAVTLKQAYGCA